VDVEITAEILARLEICCGHHLAAVVFAVVVPGERAAQAMVHADVEIEHDEDRRLQAVGEIESVRREIERFGRVFREQQDVRGVAVRGGGARDQVALLRARRHAGRRPGALHVEYYRGNFGEVGQAQKLLHQRDAGTRRGGEGARAVPGGADHDADGSELV